MFGDIITAGHISLPNMNLCNSMNSFQSWEISRIISNCLLYHMMEGEVSLWAMEVPRLRELFYAIIWNFRKVCAVSGI